MPVWKCLLDFLSGAATIATDMGVEPLTEEEYSAAPLYCESRHGRVFVGHNSAESYYKWQGFSRLVKGANLLCP
jgi:hypothetical protein